MRTDTFDFTELTDCWVHKTLSISRTSRSTGQYRCQGKVSKALIVTVVCPLDTGLKCYATAMLGENVKTPCKWSVDTSYWYAERLAQGSSCGMVLTWISYHRVHHGAQRFTPVISPYHLFSTLHSCLRVKAVPTAKNEVVQRGHSIPRHLLCNPSNALQVCTSQASIAFIPP